MALLGFHFNRIIAEKTGAASGKIKVNNNIVITKVQEAKLNMGDTKQSAVEFTFQFMAKYMPDMGSITLDGAVVYTAPQEKVKEILTKWGKEKKLTPDVLEDVYNHVLAKCNVEALVLGRDMQLPPHIQLPKVVGKK
jgi:hypothetical protein